MPIVEVLEDRIYPSLTQRYVQHMKSSVPLRTRVLPQARLLSMPNTGGSLYECFQLYAYEGGMREREELLFDLECNEANREGVSWARYLDHRRSLITDQNSAIFVEAPIVQSTNEIVGLMKSGKTPIFNTNMEGNVRCIYEIRRYKLKLGYSTVPDFLALYQEGLPSKLYADGTDPETSLVTLLYSEVGILNEVIEVWRHGNGTLGMEKSRRAARSAQPWRKAIAEIANLAKEFTSTIHIPLDASPMK